MEARDGIKSQMKWNVVVKNEHFHFCHENKLNIWYIPTIAWAMGLGYGFLIKYNGLRRLSIELAPSARTLGEVSRPKTRDNIFLFIWTHRPPTSGYFSITPNFLLLFFFR